MVKGNSARLKVSEDMLKACIRDLYINPREEILKWSKITNQTAQGKFAYPSQHLASLITSMKGGGSAARGDDLADGSEVKSCSKADQLGACKDCGTSVLVWQTQCPNCGSVNIKRDSSSHWIFPLRSASELDLLLNKVPRIVLVLFDKEDQTSADIRIRAWTVNPREKYVIDFFTDYYVNNFQKKSASGGTPAPCNLHPLKYDFFMMKPKLIFHADIKDDKITIKFWNLNKPLEQPMFSSLLSRQSLITIFGESLSKLSKIEIVTKHSLIPQRDFDKLRMKVKKLKSYKVKYTRR